MGKDLTSCLGCEYCRLLDGQAKGLDIDTAPSEINPEFSRFPVAINLFYGDPMLQIDNTLKLLEKLNYTSHKGPVVIITKSKVRNLKEIKKFKLDTHICASTFGIDHPLDGGCRKYFEYNLESLTDAGIKTSVEFRPIIYNVNDSNETMRYVFGIAKKYNVPIGYSGLQGKPEILKNLEEKNLQVEPYPGTVFHTHKKIIGKEAEKRIKDLSEEYNIPVFKKTSCLISFQHKLERDYNAHYYRPDEVGCTGCAMEKKCLDFKNSINQSVFEKTQKILPYPHEIVYKENHICTLAKQKICESVTEHCFKIKGYLIKTDEVLTTSDVRATKWLTGLTMEVKMKESSYLSSFWKK
jgi:hypothetical protein